MYNTNARIYLMYLISGDLGGQLFWSSPAELHYSPPHITSQVSHTTLQCVGTHPTELHGKCKAHRTVHLMSHYLHCILSEQMP